MMHGFWGFPMSFGWFGGVVMVLAWIFLFAGLFWLARYLVAPRCCAGSHETHLEILKRRYARGEISKEEFETRKHELDL